MRQHATMIGWPRRDPRHYRFPVPNEVWACKLRPTEFLILAYIFYRQTHDREGKTISAQATADTLHFTAATVEKHLAALASKGLITEGGTPTLKCEAGKFFSLPNEVFLLALPPSAFLIYAYLLNCEDRRTHQCHPSYRTTAGATGLSLNTAVKSVGVLAEKRLITVERSCWFNEVGLKWNGNNLYTVLPTQGGGAMKGSLDYVKRKDKTQLGDRQLVTGWNCVARPAYEKMMTTKRRYGKTDGRMFYQFVQSFSPEEDVTPEEVHTIGLELAQRLFPDFEVVVATHVDADHLHSHLIVNSVSWKDGRKFHQNAADLQRQRQISDEICAAHGLTVLEPPKKYAQEKKMRPGEYRPAVRGESWKFRLINAIDLCMRKAKTKVEFLREMEKRGYQVRWEGTRKYITYTTPKGKKCRDDQLHDERYRKEMMALVVLAILLFTSVTVWNNLLKPLLVLLQ